MLNRFLLLSAVILLTARCANAQPGKIDSIYLPAPQAHALEEYAFDSPVDPASWSAVTQGLNASFGNTNKAYFRTEVPPPESLSNSWKAIGWKGERLNGMILVWAPDTLEQVRFYLGDLHSGSGQSLKKTAIRLFKVGYVLSNYPYGAADASCGEGTRSAAYLLPDRLESLEEINGRFDLPGRTTRPVWVSIDIPVGQQAGTYKGEIEIRSSKGDFKLPVEVNVQQPTLPSPGNWSFRLDLWQNPWVIADYYNVKPWSTEHKLLLAKHLKLYADAGGKYITTYGVHSPWGDGEYYVEGGMIDWIKTNSGKWRFNYKIFDEYVDLAMKAGVKAAITVYTPLPYGERFRYRDEKTGADVYEQWKPESEAFKTNWNAFLTDLMAHLISKGWLEKTYLGINENAMEQTLSAIRIIREHSKKWRITYAGDWHMELDGLLDDYSCVYNKEPGVPEVLRRRERKQSSTFYICCTPPKPNTFVFSPPVEGRWLGWYTMAHGYDGMLRWAYDAWTADPVRDPRHIYWPSGDCYMVYPGAVSSIRFEKMREGISDFEKIRLLAGRINTNSPYNLKKMIKELQGLYPLFLEEKTFDPGKIEKDIQKGIELVNQISEKLP